MFLIRTITGRALQWLFVLAFLLMSTAAWSRTAEVLPPYGILVNVRPEGRNLSIDPNVTLPATATERKVVQFTLPSMETPYARLIESKATGTLTVRALAAAPLCGCTHIAGSIPVARSRFQLLTFSSPTLAHLAAR